MIIPQIFSTDHVVSLKRLLINNENLIGAINAGFFYLVDEKTKYPIDLNYNLCIRQGSVIGLPATDGSILLTAGAQIQAKDAKAQGTIVCGSDEYKWIGSRSKLLNNSQEHQITLYNSSCCTIRHYHSNITGSKRILEDSLNFTPKDNDVVDVLFRTDKQGRLYIKDIIKGGGANFFSGNFTLHFNSKDASHLRIGQLVKNITLDGVDLTQIDSAVSIGPNVHHFLNKQDHEINHDSSLGERPPFDTRRMARSIIYKDLKESIHIRVFDGAPKTKYFQGITPHETSLLLPQETVQWAFHLDPGQSARLAFKEKNNKVNTFGNMHYMRWPKKQGHPFLWSPSNGRRVPSAIILSKK